jgi:hypothetical protein
VHDCPTAKQSAAVQSGVLTEEHIAKLVAERADGIQLEGEGDDWNNMVTGRPSAV